MLQLIKALIVGCLLMTAGFNSTREYATNATDKAVADVTKRNVADAMKQFRRDLDGQLQTAGNAITATISVIAGTTITLTDTPFGARLLRKNMKIQMMDSAQAGYRGNGCTIIGNVVNSLGKAQTIIVDQVPPGTIVGDVIVPNGLFGASPTGLYGLAYHHNSTTSGSWMGISRSNSYVQADLVSASSNALALPFLRLAVDKIMQNIGIDEEEALKNLVWYGHRMQKAAYQEIAASISMIHKEGSDQDIDLMFRSETIGGVKTKWSIHADPTRLDLVNLDTWGRVEWKEVDYLQIGDTTVFPVYGASGGIASAYLFYLVAGEQYFIGSSVKSKSSLIDSNGEIPNEAEPARDRERLSEKTSSQDDAIVWTARNKNLQRPAEMTGPRASGVTASDNPRAVGGITGLGVLSGYTTAA